MAGEMPAFPRPRRGSITVLRPSARRTEDAPMPTDDKLRSDLGGLSDELRAALAFLTRLPGDWLGPAAKKQPDFRQGARVFPLAGAVIGLIGGFVLALAATIGIPPFLSAILAVATTMLVTGGLHEDGLSDTADGFGGGATTARRLEIMKDSRIGTFGAAALLFSVLLRIGALAAIATRAPYQAALALIAAEAVSRGAMVRLWHDLPPARPGGLSSDAGAPDAGAMFMALALSAGVAALMIWPVFGFGATLLSLALAAAATFGFERLSVAAIDGRTGDTLGACQQVAAIAFLLGVAAFA